MVQIRMRVGGTQGHWKFTPSIASFPLAPPGAGEKDERGVLESPVMMQAAGPDMVSGWNRPTKRYSSVFWSLCGHEVVTGRCQGISTRPQTLLTQEMSNFSLCQDFLSPSGGKSRKWLGVRQEPLAHAGPRWRALPLGKNRSLPTPCTLQELKGEALLDLLLLEIQIDVEKRSTTARRSSNLTYA